MTTTHAYDELINRLEAATGSDRELDADIEVAITPTVKTDDDLIYAMRRSKDGSDATSPGHYFIKSRSGMSCKTAPAYTADINAALMLVPSEDSSNFEVCLEQSKRRTRAYWTATIGHMHFDAWVATAPTPALALCIAALRARQSLPTRSTAG